MERRLPTHEVSQHNKPHDAWVVVDGNIYDLTDFAPTHPGGSEVIYRYAGKDATLEYNKFHAPSLIRTTLKPQYHIGRIDESTITEEWRATTLAIEAEESNKDRYPPLSTIINLYDFEHVAQRSLSTKSWAYISSGANDNITRDANDAFLKRIWLRPAVLRNVGAITTRATLFGAELALPIYIAPMGQARTGGPDGELALARAAAAGGILHCISTPASYPHAEILAAANGAHGTLFQLYVHRDRAISEATLRAVAASGRVRALIVTADLPVVSKREADERARLDDESTNGRLDAKGGGLARQTGSFIDPTLCWSDLAWLRGITDLPIVIKGIQRAEDAKMAMRMGCQGVVISNHGGRAADGAPPAILTLLELHKNCPEVFEAMEVLVDGGFRRGSDVVKAICLGASAVGIGRPFMYAIGYGQQGIEHAIEIMKDEIETAMRLCGLTDLMRDASPDFVNTADIDHLVPGPRHPYARKAHKVKAKF